MASQTSEHEKIRNTIVIYTRALDEKNWAKLEQCLAPDISLEYPPPLAVWKSLPECQAGFKKSLDHLSNFHSLSTQSIELTGPNTATAMTYCTANHFEGDKFLSVHGRYDDEMVKGIFNGKEEWRIKRRVVTVMGTPQGDWSLIR